MTFATIFLHATTLQQDLLPALALCIVPFLLGWAFAFFYHRVSDLNIQVEELTIENKNMLDDIHKKDSHITDLGVQIAAEEAKIHQLSEENYLQRRKIELLEIELRECRGEDAGGKKKKA